jgi:hypothetical protein
VASGRCRTLLASTWTSSEAPRRRVAAARLSVVGPELLSSNDDVCVCVCVARKKGIGPFSSIMNRIKFASRSVESVLQPPSFVHVCARQPISRDWSTKRATWTSRSQHWMSTGSRATRDDVVKLPTPNSKIFVARSILIDATSKATACSCARANRPSRILNRRPHCGGATHTFKNTMSKRH